MIKTRFRLIEWTSVRFTYEHFVHPLSLILIGKGWNVLASFNPLAEHISTIRNALSPVSFVPSSVSRSIKPDLLVHSIFSIFKILSKSRASIVHVHTPLLSYLVRIIFLVRGFRHKHKILYTVHGFYFCAGSSPLSNIIHFLTELVLLSVCNKILFVSKSDFDFAQKFFPHVASNCFYVGNFVDTFFFLPRVAPAVNNKFFNSIRAESFVIGFVGRLVREKGILDLLNAFSILLSAGYDVTLLVVGDILPTDYDKSVLPELQSFASRYPDSIVLTGMIEDRSCLLSAYHCMDVFCLPSYREGLPTVLLEALSCGIPSVATSIRGCNELIIDDVNGLLVPPHSPSEIACSIAKIISDVDLRIRFSTMSRKFVVEKFDQGIVLRRQVDIILDMAREMDSLNIA